MTCRRGHLRPTGGRCPTCQFERESAEHARIKRLTPDVAARARRIGQEAPPPSPALLDRVVALFAPVREARSRAKRAA